LPVNVGPPCPSTSATLEPQRDPRSAPRRCADDSNRWRESLVDQLLAALDRGSPLAEVLRAHALDAREDSERALLEAAGTREVAMLIPLVFLILPVTVLFAVWPGLMVLQLGF
jgi:hypothetical protein